MRRSACARWRRRVVVLSRCYVPWSTSTVVVIFLSDQAIHRHSCFAIIKLDGWRRYQLSAGGAARIAAADEIDPSMATMLRAAIDAAAGDTASAERLLAEWGRRYLPAAPGLFAAALSADYAHLLATVSS